MQIVLIPLSLLLLYLTRRKLTIELGRLIRRFDGRNRAFAIVWSVIFLPGTIIHEMSHFFAAAFTGTHIGNVEIFPSLPRAGIGQNESPKDIHLGSVQTQELGLIRGFFVGAAPFLVGLGLLVWISSSEVVNFSCRAGSCSAGQFSILDLLKLYLFFNVANSLFLSWVDFKHALPLIVVVAMLAGLLYLFGIQPTITPNSLIIKLLSRLQAALAWSVGINTIAASSLWILNRMFSARRV